MAKSIPEFVLLKIDDIELLNDNPREINEKRVEKHASNRGVRFAIGNIDEAKKKYKTEAELLEACFA